MGPFSDSATPADARTNYRFPGTKDPSNLIAIVGVAMASDSRTIKQATEPNRGPISSGGTIEDRDARQARSGKDTA
jgi:hypothetical protein